MRSAVRRPERTAPTTAAMARSGSRGMRRTSLPASSERIAASLAP